MDLDPSRRLSLDLITSDLAEPAELTALLAAHVLEPARLLYGMPRPRPDEDDRTTFGNLVDLDGQGHTVLMRIEEPLDETVARFAPFVRGFMLLCRLFPQIVDPDAIERGLIVPASSFFERSRSLAHLIWADLECLVGGLLRHDGPPRPRNRALTGGYEPAANDAARAELLEVQDLLRHGVRAPNEEGPTYARLDIGLFAMSTDVAGRIDAILREGARQRLVWFGDAELGYERAPGGGYRERAMFVDRGVFPSVIPETISAVFALDFVETLRLDRRTAICSHCDGPLLLDRYQAARVRQRKPVYHRACAEEHRARYIRDYQRRWARRRRAAPT